MQIIELRRRRRRLKRDEYIPTNIIVEARDSKNIFFFSVSLIDFRRYLERLGKID